MWVTVAAPARFEVEVSPNPFNVSEFVDVTIKAVDAAGNVDPTYVDGDIWMEIEGLDYTDPDVILPGGGIGRMEPADQWIKIFSKWLTVKRPWIYTFVVADVYETTINWSVEIEVLDDMEGPEVSDIEVVSPVSWGVEKDDNVEVIGSTTYPNTPLEIFIDGVLFQEGISDPQGNFVLFLSWLEPGEHVLKINALDLTDAVVATSWDIPFSYDPEMGELFLWLDVEPSNTVMINEKLTFTIRTAPQVTSAFLKLWEGDLMPTEKVQPWVFTKQIAISNAGVYPADVELSVDGNRTMYEDVETITIEAPVEETKRIITLNYTTDDARKKADLVWTYEWMIEYFKIKYGTDRNTLRLSLTTSSPNGMLVLADPTIPYYAQVYPVDENGIVNGEPSAVITIDPVLPPEPICWNGRIETWEQCDDGNVANGDGCALNCTIEVVVPQPPVAVCGNGAREGIEQCDDGNIMNGDGCSFACQIEVVTPTPPVSRPIVPTCNPQWITLSSKKMNDKYYLVWASVPNATEYIIYRADQAVQNTQQMSVVGKTTETMFEYPFDPYAETDKWAWYAVEAICVDNVQKQVGDMTMVKVGPEKTILVMVMLLIIGFSGWRMIKTY